MSINSTDSCMRCAPDNLPKTDDDSSGDKEFLRVVLGTLGKALQALSESGGKSSAPGNSTNDLLKSLLKLLEELLSKLGNEKGGGKPGSGAPSGAPEQKGETPAPAPGASDKPNGGGNDDVFKSILKLLEQLIAKLDTKGSDQKKPGESTGGESADLLKSLLKTLEELLAKLDAKSSGKGEKGAPADDLENLKSKLADLSKKLDESQGGGKPESKAPETQPKPGETPDSNNDLATLLKQLTQLIEQLLAKLDGKEGTPKPAPKGEKKAEVPDKQANTEQTPTESKNAPPAEKPTESSTPPNTSSNSTPSTAPNPTSNTTPGGTDSLSKAPQTAANTPEQTKQVSEQYITNLQKDFGMTREQAIGVVANLSFESAGMNSGINQGGKIGQPSANNADDNANGYGIAQWGGERKQGLIDYAKKNGLDPSSQAANYGFLKQELSGNYKGVIDDLKAATSPTEATKVFSQSFEKPSDPQLQGRLSIAEQLDKANA